MGHICIHCKRIHATNEECPYEKSYLQLFKSNDAVGDHVEGASPMVFVGRYGYPKVNVGILTPDQIHEAELFDAPRSWAKHNFSVNHVANLRRKLVQSRFVAGIQETNKQVEMAQELAMATKPSDVDINLQKAPKQLNTFDGVSAPYGPTGELKQGQLTQNTKVSIHVEKAVGDTDMKAATALEELYNKKFDERPLMKLLSLGTLGKGSLRKLVPTRWAITATDDTLAKHIRNEVLDHAHCEHKCYFGGYLGNYYLILFFPGMFSFELFETHTNSLHSYATDYESHKGRKSYAEQTAGGYYACRYPILELCNKEKEQGAILALRFITPAYTAPLGVWVVREATRNSLNQEPHYTADRTELLQYAKDLIKQKLNIDIALYLKKSRLLEDLTSQTRLQQFFS